MNLRTILLVFLCFCATTVLRAERVDMLKAGAKANGKALNTKLINSTIDRLNRGGGGTLFFPAGTYLTGSIHLKATLYWSWKPELLCSFLTTSMTTFLLLRFVTKE